MIEEAEMFRDADKAQKEKIDARNSFENYVYSLRNTIEDPEKLGNKISESDKQTVKDAISDAQSWIEANMSAEKHEFEEHQKELEK